MADKIHLKHSIPSGDPRLKDRGYMNMIKAGRTACWTPISSGMKVTADRSKVTCKKCLQKSRK